MNLVREYERLRALLAAHDLELEHEVRDLDATTHIVITCRRCHYRRPYTLSQMSYYASIISDSELLRAMTEAAHRSLQHRCHAPDSGDDFLPPRRRAFEARDRSFLPDFLRAGTTTSTSRVPHSYAWERNNKPAYNKAEKLLLAKCTEAQAHEWEKYRYISCEGSLTGGTGVVYRLTAKTVYGILVLLHGRVVGKLCLTSDNSIPEPDRVLSLKLLVETDEAAFIQKANTAIDSSRPEMTAMEIDPNIDAPRMFRHI